MTYTTAERLADLDAISTTLAAEKGGGWLAAAVAESIAAELDRQAAAPTPPERIQALLISGLVGARLNRELWARFPDAGRADVFAGVAMAVTVLEARTALAEIEAAIVATERAEAA
jgi:hypothetical protein